MVPKFWVESWLSSELADVELTKLLNVEVSKPDPLTTGVETDVDAVPVVDVVVVGAADPVDVVGADTDPVVVVDPDVVVDPVVAVEPVVGAEPVEEVEPVVDPIPVVEADPVVGVDPVVEVVEVVVFGIDPVANSV